MTDLFPYPDPDPYRDTDKTCHGGGMHCPSVSCCLLIAHHSVCLLATSANTSERICMKFSGKIGNGPMFECWWRSGSPS